MSELLYIDAISGVSASALAGALLDLGWPESELESLAQSPGLSGIKLSCVRETRQGISASRLNVSLPKASPPTPPQAEEMLAGLPENIAAPAIKALKRLARAQARISGVPADQIALHDACSYASLIKAAVVCAGLAWFKIGRIICSPLPLGQGFVNAQPGGSPLPSPVVLELLSGSQITSRPNSEETVTPLGAALISTLADEYGPIPAMRLEATGMGRGEIAQHMLRVLKGRAEAGVTRDSIVEILCNLDDHNPEDLPLAFEKLLDAGALDVALTPLVMKKGRAGHMMSVMAPPALSDELARMMLELTTSLGVRMRVMERRLLERRMISVETPWGEVRIKLSKTGRGWRPHVESDDVAAIAGKTGHAMEYIRRKVLVLAADQIDPK